jgi:NDP-sugar pyrophosphorylase family protein
MLSPSDFFDLGRFSQAGLFSQAQYVWEALGRIKPFLNETLKPNLEGLSRRYGFLTRTVILHEGEFLEEGFELIPGDATKGEWKVLREGKVLEGASVIMGGVTLLEGRIYLGRGSVVESGAFIKGPCYIGDQTEVRQGAYLRGNCVVGDHCVVGHVTELKNAIFLNGAKAGHFAYVGDSILGNNCNLGAGTKLANLKIIRTPISIRLGKEEIPTQLRKLGAILGDGTETGCNSVTSPGTLMGPKCLVSPNATVKGGYYPPKTIIR